MDTYNYIKNKSNFFQYIDRYKHQQAISVNKYDLGLATNFKHKIHLKDNNPVYRKQFKIPEAHQNFIEQSLDEWLKLGVVKRANSLKKSKKISSCSSTNAISQYCDYFCIS